MAKLEAAVLLRDAKGAVESDGGKKGVQREVRALQRTLIGSLMD